MEVKGVFSHESDEWATPKWLYDELDAEFHFNYDPCATADNHKCFLWTSKEDDGLTTDWGGQRVFCNPPYSDLPRWVEKAYRETRKDDTLVCMLLPARTDTRYFWNYIWQRSEVRFIKGRVHYENSEGKRMKFGSPFPTMIVIFRGANLKGD